MKKSISIITVICVALLLFASCAKSDDSPEPSTVVFTEPVETTVSHELTEDEIISLFTKANDLYFNWVSHGWGPELDRSQVITVDGNEYAKIVFGEFSSTDELYAELDKHFVKDNFREKLDKTYKMHNGEMYGSYLLGQGGGPPVNKVEIKILSRASDEYIVSISSYSLDDTAYTKEYRLVNVDGSWLFSGEFTGILGIFERSEEVTWIK